MVTLDFNALLRTEDWIEELGSLLPLSALLDFLDASRVLHIYQLTGATAWWCWPITPAGFRMLLSRRATDETCLLDDFDASTTPVCLDGRYGDKYPLANPETLRLCLGAAKPHPVPNTHKNMLRRDVRPHTVDLVHVTRRPSHQDKPPLFFSNNLFAFFSRLAGWIVWGLLMAFSVVSASWLLLTFLLLVTATGCVVANLFPPGPRSLRVDHGSEYNRLVLSAQHMNATHWTIYYGESSVVNSLLNWPLRLESAPEPIAAERQESRAVWLRWLLRVLILGQWAMTVGAAALKDWNAYGISFWIFFCIFMNAWSFATEHSVGIWLRHAAVGLERYTVQVSSRRALLNLVLALNPDTFALDARTQKTEVSRFSPGAVLWMDDILKAGESRSAWEDASRLAMIGAMEANGTETGIGDDIGGTQKDKCMAAAEAALEGYSRMYWFDFIGEGIQVAQGLTGAAGLGGRLATKSPSSRQQ
ncbi:hypothetical protein SODALDRAFT_333004 [Sodiomyces alkalinus F11]|uniref:Uncharacterized protein n=1 Tax=Sodiomyces alkalinus (strain CBS 110278 / VKM F-3762 / F11) TaxID=1314773 RepID=A0A3N2PVB4_SODAK|nr:hypothetical protein SODALDRAFT_333004 [Sodiomyces alkalinus F11]ROT38430.1 hypothetical protein SODALDRAFT_333004 [Sodiomyces alkalinus F11]